MKKAAKRSARIFVIVAFLSPRSTEEMHGPLPPNWGIATASVPINSRFFSLNRTKAAFSALKIVAVNL